MFKKRFASFASAFGLAQGQGQVAYRLSFPGCCWMSSRRYFLANNINPFMGLLGLSQSFSFFLAGEGGGGEPLAEEELVEVEPAPVFAPKTNAEPP